MEESIDIPERWVGWNKVYESAYGRYYTKIVLNFMLDNLQISNSSNYSIVDIGGGMGRFAIPLAEKGFNVTINDIDKTALSIMSKRFPNMQFISGDFFQTAFPQKYDIVISIGVIKLMNSPSRLLMKKMYDVLKPNGKIIIENLNPDSLRRKYGKLILKNCTFPTEIQPKVLKSILVACGFKNIKMKSFSILTPPVKVDLPVFVKLAEFIETKFNLYDKLSLGTQYITYAEK